MKSGEEQNLSNSRRPTELKTIILEEDKKVQNDFRIATNAQFKARELLHNAEANKELIGPDRLASLDRTMIMAVKELNDVKINKKLLKSSLTNRSHSPVIRRKSRRKNWIN